jgi:hypothetical protein
MQDTQKVLERVLEKMKEKKVGRMVGKGVKTCGSGRSLVGGLQ